MPLAARGAAARRVLRPGGRLAVLAGAPATDAEGQPGPPAAHRVAQGDAEAARRAAGFALSETVAVAFPRHYLPVGTTSSTCGAAITSGVSARRTAASRRVAATASSPK